MRSGEEVESAVGIGLRRRRWRLREVCVLRDGFDGGGGVRLKIRCTGQAILDGCQDRMVVKRKRERERGTRRKEDGG